MVLATGLTTKKALAALTLPATMAMVSSAPYSLPPASQVCCMRLSLESSGPSAAEELRKYSVPLSRVA